MSRPADVAAYLFDSQPHPLSAEFMQWLDASPRFTTFAETYRDKIRKKLRVTRQPESLLDLRSELEVAYCLLKDRRLAVAYEPYASAGGRGPDFAITYRANQVFNVEVTRVHLEGSQADGIDLLRVLMDKLGQMQPGMPNLLVLHAQAEFARSIDLDAHVQAVKTVTEDKESPFYTLSRYPNPAAFYREFLHLNAILFWAAGAPLWINRQARPALDEKVIHQVAALRGN